MKTETDRLIETIIDRIASEESVPGRFESLSGLHDHLRSKGWRVPSATPDFWNLIEELGFSVKETKKGKRTIRIVTL